VRSRPLLNVTSHRASDGLRAVIDSPRPVPRSAVFRRGVVSVRDSRRGWRGSARVYLGGGGRHDGRGAPARGGGGSARGADRRRRSVAGGAAAMPDAPVVALGRASVLPGFIDSPSRSFVQQPRREAVVPNLGRSSGDRMRSADVAKEVATPPAAMSDTRLKGQKRLRYAGPSDAPKRTRTSTQLAWTRPSTW
jgi:hypothetical protein